MSAVGSITETISKTRTMRSIAWDWTSSAGGAVSGIPSTAISGVIERVVFVPGAGGVEPTDAYDVTLLDEDGFDVLVGLGGNLAQSSATQIVPLLGDGTTTADKVAIDGQLTLTVANAGEAKQGRVKLYYR
jgi:hypothetical protein